ncbi:MAG: 4-alpha-glucanotransferase, partial [Acidimicrobiia bacterium]|nr:4-alpha-glucanotransferase [Acidimicrobiia bacterium]
MKSSRESGLLLHPTSLPGHEGIGTIGRGAVEFLDSLQRSEQNWWQMLPVGPTGYADSPYQSPSAFAGNPLMVDLSHLASEGLLDGNNVPVDGHVGPVDYGRVTAIKPVLLDQAAATFQLTGTRADEFEKFRSDNSSWLADYSLYAALKQVHDGRSWIEWDHRVRDRDPDSLDEARRSLSDSIRSVEITQFFFEMQWESLRREASGREIGLVGDLPIFVAHDSADVWANRHLFD